MRTVDPAQHAAKREAIRNAAVGCFADKGFERTTTADLCRAAGISSGSLFHYFPTKRAIFTAIFEEDARETAERFEAAGDPWASLLEIAEEMAEELAHPMIARLQLEAAAQAARDDEFAALVRRSEIALRDGFAKLIERAVAAGEIDPGLPATDAAGWVAGLLNAVVSRAGLEPDVDAVAERTVLRVILTRFLRPVVAVSPPDAADVPQTGH